MTFYDFNAFTKLPPRPSPFPPDHYPYPWFFHAPPIYNVGCAPQPSNEKKEDTGDT